MENNNNSDVKKKIGLKDLNIKIGQKVDFFGNQNHLNNRSIDKNNSSFNAINIKQIDSDRIIKSISITNNQKDKNNNSHIESENRNFKPNIQEKQQNQFRKPTLSFQKENFTGKIENQTNNQKDKNNNSHIESENRNFKPNIQEKQQNQFRKPTLSFQKENFTGKIENQTNNQKDKNNKQQFQNKNNFFNNTKNKDFSNKKDFNSNGNNRNFNNFQKKNEKNNNFFKKSTQIKVKLKPGVRKEQEKQVFRKTSSTGSNVDKYSINGMLKTMSSNIELDTEIDDVLGNVISVKLAGINSSNSLQKERKIRVSKNKNDNNKVNFNIPIVRKIEIFNNKISLANLADQMAISVKELNKLFRSEGIDIDMSGYKDIGDVEIDGDTAELIAETCGHIIKRISNDDAENNFISALKEDRTDVKTRAPIVTIMGHVDHGKTTLLDYIRKTSVASGEAGGITQHIGAYRTKIKDKFITFLDTPGHAAFTEMRARGAQITDIVVIVVAADDGIMPQTEEAISHAKNSGCPIIVAINKIDKPEANIERTKQMLLQYELVPEDLGGDIMVIPISAKEGRNVDKLLEAILLQAEMLGLQASYNGIPEGYVVEAKMDKKRGALATVIVKEGTLKQGDFIIVGEQYGKIKGMFDENGKIVKEAEPSIPVEILGLNSVPNAGEIFYAVKNEKDVKDIINNRINKAREDFIKIKNSSIDTSFSLLDGNVKEEKCISFIIKADTKGSLEAIVNSLSKFDNNEVKLKIAHSAVGSVNETDVLLCSTCNGVIMTFNTQKADKKVLEEAEKRNVEIRDYKIIYELFDDIKDILNGNLKPVVKKDIQGHAEVKAIFEISKVGKIAGCVVKDGKIYRGSNVAIIRNGENIFETKCDSLKHGKEVVKEIQSGQECGIGLVDIDKVNEGDILEFFIVKEGKNVNN